MSFLVLFELQPHVNIFKKMGAKGMDRDFTDFNFMNFLEIKHSEKAFSEYLGVNTVQLRILIFTSLTHAGLTISDVLISIRKNLNDVNVMRLVLRK